MTRSDHDVRPAAWALFRRRFTMDNLPASAPTRVVSDSRHIVWVNGVEVARGPVRTPPGRPRYDTFDAAPQLRRGANIVAALVRYYGSPTPWWAPVNPTRHQGAGGLLLEAELGDLTLISDDTWRVLGGDAWEEAPSPGLGGPPEVLDGRRLPRGWTEPGFDDGDWPAAVVLGANHFGFDGDHSPPTLPHAPLQPRPIGPLGGSFRRPPGTPGHLPRTLDQGREIVDFGEVVSGTVVLEVECPPGTRFHIAVGEGVETVAGLGDRTEMISYTAPGGRSRFESFDPLGFRFLHLDIESTEEIDGYGGDHPGVTLLELGVQERLHRRGTGPLFICDDDDLNRIWAAGRRTVDLCSHDAYIDCPTREQRAWLGDAATTMSIDLVSNANWDLARWNSEMLASPRSDGMLPMAVAGDFEHLDFTFIPDFACHWVHSLEILRMWTGDRDLVARLLPVAERALRWFEPFQGPDGLLDHVPGWVFIDWAAVSTSGRCAALNGLWGRALVDLATVSRWLGQSATEAWARERHEHLRVGFEQFWDPDRGLYVDHITSDGRRPPTSQHAQAAAVVGDLVSPERLEILIPHLVDSNRLVDTYWGDQAIGGPALREGPPEPHWDVERLMVRAQPGFRPVVHDALVLAGRPDLIPSACRDWIPMLDRCPTTLSETWTAGTTCHAWSATPTRDLIIRTAGITPAEPGFATVGVAPAPGGLDWLRASTPTPAGLVSVEVQSGRVTIDSPVPVFFDPSWLWGGSPVRLDPGHNEIEP